MYRYGSSTKQNGFRSNKPLTNEEIAHYAPSVLATEPHDSRGERYGFIPTINVLDGLRKEGFEPFEVRQTKVKDQSKREHTKHLVRMRHPNALALDASAEVPEIILVNSHDGSSSYQLLSGFFRFVCSNGLIAGDVCDDIRIRHQGNIIDNVIEGSYRVLDNIELANNRIGLYKDVKLDREEQLAFADAAIDLRWDRNEETLKAPVQASSLISVRRTSDYAADAWTTLNVVQENLIKGGLRSVSDKGRRGRTREVGGVNENVKLNRAVWTLMDHLVKHKTGAM
ncbi:MAG: DUF932 domain-containing protein [Patescibacteria group bacterium]|nr:DUF932 domain-containing protein [Patescibacteria group bacterium]